MAMPRQDRSIKRAAGMFYVYFGACKSLLGGVMDYWGAKIYNYCERGQESGFWAEPLNAISNAAFIIAALIATLAFFSQARERRGLAEAGLILLVYVIGTGSFLFHTYATRWASIADTAPIGLFMLAYFAY